jgi:hypothetical protein
MDLETALSQADTIILEGEGSLQIVKFEKELTLLCQSFDSGEVHTMKLKQLGKKPKLYKSGNRVKYFGNNPDHKSIPFAERIKIRTRFLIQPMANKLNKNKWLTSLKKSIIWMVNKERN